MGINLFPMNAKPAKDKFFQLMNDDLYIAQEKIDGVRALIYTNKVGRVSVTTRGESVSAPGVPIDITHRIPHVQDWIPHSSLWGSVLDCEITIDGLDSALTAGVVTHKSTVKVPDGLRFNCFDIIGVGGKLIINTVQGDRLTILGEAAEYFPEWVQTIPVAMGTDYKEDLLDKIWSVGKEGIMLKNTQAKYFPDKRPSNTWYKVKKVDTVDAKIVGSAPPEKYYRDQVTNAVDFGRLTKPYANGWFGALVYELEDGTQGTVSGFDDSEKAKMSHIHEVKPEYIGRYMELKFMEKTKDGKLRHPRFIRLREIVEK